MSGQVHVCPAVNRGGGRKRLRRRIRPSRTEGDDMDGQLLHRLKCWTASSKQFSALTVRQCPVDLMRNVREDGEFVLATASKRFDEQPRITRVVRRRKRASECAIIDGLKDTFLAMVGCTSEGCSSTHRWVRSGMGCSDAQRRGLRALPFDADCLVDAQSNIRVKKRRSCCKCGAKCVLL